MIVTAHQSNFLPGVSIIEKIAASDAVIWLDEVQYTSGGWSNRNKMPDGSWLTVPIDRESASLSESKYQLQVAAPFNRVKISEHNDWRLKARKTLEQNYGVSEDIQLLCDEILRPYKLLIGLNLALLRWFTEPRKWHFQSHLDGGHAVKAVSDEVYELLPISDRLARMVQELGGTTYLSGPSGYRYLDERPFIEREIEVKYWQFDKPNQCCMINLVAGRVGR